MWRIMGCMKITYDSEAEAAYIRLSKGNVHRTQKVADNLLIDLNRKGKVLGVELLFVSAA